MYSIYCDDKCIYTDQSSNMDYKILDGNLDLEMNTAGTLSLTIPFTNRGYNLIKKMQSHITVFRGTEKIWGGRPITDSQDFDKNKTYTCEGELAYLNDTYQPVHTYKNMTIPEFISTILAVHNAKCDGSSTPDSPYPDDDQFAGDTSVTHVSVGTFDKEAYYENIPDETGWSYLTFSAGARGGDAHDPSSGSITWSTSTQMYASSDQRMIYSASEFVDTSDYTFSKVHLTIDCAPYVLKTSGTDLKSRSFTYRYRLIYKVAGGTVQMTNWTPNTKLSKTFDDVKINVSSYNANVNLYVGVEVKKFDKSAMTSTDTTRLNSYSDLQKSECYFRYKYTEEAYSPTKKYNRSTSTRGSHRSKKIYPGVITVYDNADCEYRYTNYESTFDTIKKLVDELGGAVRIRTGTNGKLYLDYLREYVNVNTQTIEFGKNLLDYTTNHDMSNVCTVLLPLGSKSSSEDETKVGDEIDPGWYTCSAILSDGTIFKGPNFHITTMMQVTQTSDKYTYDTIEGTSTKETFNNRIYYIGEQINGYIMWEFFGNNFEPLSSHIASSNTRTEQHTSWYGDNAGSGLTYTEVPSGAKYVAFGWYYGGDGEYKNPDKQILRNKRTYDTMFRAKYEDAFGVQWEVDQNSVRNQYSVKSNLVLRTQKKSDDGGYPQTANFCPYVVDEPVNRSYVISNPYPVKEGQKYYITSRQNLGYGYYCIYRDDGYPVTTDSMKSASEDYSYSDINKEEVEMPIGARFLVCAGIRGADLDPKLNGELTANTTYEEQLDEYVTIESVNNNSLYLVNDELVKQFGWIERQVTFDDAETPEALLDLAKKYMAKVNFEDTSIEISALDLSLINHAIEGFDLLDLVWCSSPPHGLERYFPVTKMSIPFLAPENATLTLGEEPKESTLSGTDAANDLEIFERIGKIPEPSSIIKTAVANATNIINLDTNSFVRVNPNEILIMDTDNPNTATRMWRMNANGIGYSSNGYFGPFGLAFTMDGAIVADRITTGFMHADRIRGGTLTLGGFDNVNGEFYMQNAEGKNFIKMTKDGAEMITKISQPYGFVNTTNNNVTYGVLTIDKGLITGNAAELSVKGKKRMTSTNKWWENYVFAFDDVTRTTPLTCLDLFSVETSGLSNELYGTALYSYNFLKLCLTDYGDRSNFIPTVAGIGRPGIFWNKDDGFRMQFRNENSSDYIYWTPNTNPTDAFSTTGLTISMFADINLVARAVRFNSRGNNTNLEILATAKTININSDSYKLYKTSGGSITPLTDLTTTFTAGDKTIKVINGFVTEVV